MRPGGSQGGGQGGQGGGQYGQGGGQYGQGGGQGGPRPPFRRGPGGPGGGRPSFGGKKRNFKPFKKKPMKRRPPAPPPVNTMEYTGFEALYLKTLMEQETPVVLKLTSGELVRGYVRYYDKDTFSFSPGDGSPKMFVRKTGVRYLYEEPAEESAKYAKLAPSTKEDEYVEAVLMDDDSDDEEFDEDDEEYDEEYEDDEEEDEEYEEDDEEEEVAEEKPAPKPVPKPASPARAPRVVKK